MTERKTHVLVDSLQKQEAQEERDGCGRFLKGVSGNPEGRFKPGQCGNPAGRRPGSRNKATESAELLLEGEAEALTRKAVELALGGDPIALRLCLDRLIPPRRGRKVQLDAALPVCDVAELGPTMAAVTTAAISGEITPGEAAELARVVEIYAGAVEVTDFDRRLRELERQYKEADAS
jgi:Family of unknown function (DUF5681)